MIARALALLLAQAQPADSLAISVSAAVSADTVTVGDRFTSLLAVRHAPGVRVSFEGFPPGDTLQLVDPVRPLRVDGASTTVAYPLAAWVAGAPIRQVVRIVATDSSGARRSYRVALRLPVVRSVLPAEGEVVPRPPKPLFPAGAADYRWLWWLVAVFAASLAAGALLWRRFRRPRHAALPDPRSEALAALDSLAGPRAGDAAAVAAHYTAVVRALRRYLARSRPMLGEDLTTAELLARAGDAEPDRGLPALASLLARADPVKFAGAPATPDDAREFRGAVREWIAADAPAASTARRAA